MPRWLASLLAVFGKLGAVDAKVETSATATGAGTSASGSVSAS